MDDQRPSDNKPETPVPPSPVPPAQEPGVTQTEFINHWQTDGPEQSAPKPRRRWIFVAAVLVLIVLAAVVVFLVTRHKRLPITPNNSASIVKPPPKPATSETPLGQAAKGSSDTAGISIKVVGVINKPPVTGDPADKGQRYLEIDLSINDSGSSDIVPGTFVYQSADGKLINTAGSAAAGSDNPQKNVQVPGKQSLEDLSLKRNQTAGPVYLIYQVPQTDKGGKLIWYDGYYDTSSTKLAIFDLD